ncbi:hypothetical protein PTTG_29910 [Puccinia triticina 1-1 BBBD Race 1]|uniref:Kinesin motor domain-containing protein n=1 Tax=Puccinia triticina (isolate 1-1 / race 1 (BBBD)) TaxID=630390 RepID=A0A180G185_PUCT1|nr:hypothetical protein PTTG_29910 [Puccinia triticina 1-1 BBBD Race 1]
MDSNPPTFGLSLFTPTHSWSSFLSDSRCSILIHTIFSLNLAQSKPTTAQHKRLKRTAAACLNALGNIILALVNPSKSNTATQIPYRDSKPIQIIQDSLGGNAQTLMVACVFPSEHNVGEALNTTRLKASRVGRRSIPRNSAGKTSSINHHQVAPGVSIPQEQHLPCLPTLLMQTKYSCTSKRKTLQDKQSPDYPDLQGYFTELQAKYAKTLSDLAHAQNHLKLALSSLGVPQAISQSAFDEMIQPIVKEYKKFAGQCGGDSGGALLALAHLFEKEQEKFIDKATGLGIGQAAEPQFSLKWLAEKYEEFAVALEFVKN